MSIEDIFDIFGLKSTAYLRTNCHVDFPLNQKAQKSKVHVYITTLKHICDELVKLNGVEFKGKFSFIEIAKVKPKAADPSKINFTSRNRFEPLRFANNSPDLDRDTEHSEEGDLGVGFKRTVRNSQEN